MSAGSHAPAPVPVTAVVAQRVKPDRTDEFRAWQEELNRAVASFVGFLGTQVIEPTDGDEWTIIYRFDSAESLDAWLGSDARHDRDLESPVADESRVFARSYVESTTWRRKRWASWW